MVTKKLLQGVMEEIRLLEKRLEKETEIFEKYSALAEFEKPEIGKADNNVSSKFDRDLAAKTMQGKYQSYLALVTRLAMLKKIRDVTNMNTFTSVILNESKLSIYDCIQYKKSIFTHLIRMYEAIERGKERVANLNQLTVTQSLASGKKSSVTENIETYALLPLKEIEKKYKELQELMAKVDSAISVANATTEIEVPD